MRAFAIVLLSAGGMVVPLDHAAIQDALVIGNSSFETDHRRFHADYHFPLGSAPVDFISVVTPFRRVVLAAETEARQGRRSFGQREALAALQPDPDRLEVYAELTFHPHHTYLAVPSYTMELDPGSRGVPIAPHDMERIPRFAPRVEAPWYPLPYPLREAPRLPSRTETLLGGTLIARFAGSRLDAKAAYSVVIRDGTRELARARLDLGRVR
jgi:hypothetical protein